jgi:putative heme-binding domain-containing protein
LQDMGNEVGPDLAALSNKTPLYLLTEILAPNKNVDTRYIEYVAVTKAGRTFTGILASETATSITLKGQEGKEQVLLRSELEEFQSTGKSLMPEGLEKDLSKQDLADLIAYVTSGGMRP